MDSVCKELDEVKLELDKMKDEDRIKSGLLENLRKVNDDQAVRYQEVKLQMEKLAQELRTKEGEVAESRHLYEDVKCRLQETESSLKQANSVNEKLRVECGEKVQRLEEENRKLVFTLDEATLKASESERQLCACREEAAGLKMLLLDSERKCLEAEQKIEMKKALSNRDDAIMKLEEECVDFQDRLKWKTEQFEHLEEAHKLLQEQFQTSKQEWASEKTTLLEEISSLQFNLDTQIRVNESLQSELKMCNQALAHEESRRRALEIQLSESKESFENVLGEFNEAKSKMEILSMERDEKVASLRNALGTKNAHVKELEYRISHLEQDNKELLQSVKELQEAQIGRKKPDSSLIKLRNKLRDLEQTHNRCSVLMEEREVEWNLKMEKMIGQVTKCEFDLKTKTEEINQLKMQVESCQSSIDISGEEISILLMVLKSGYSEVYSNMMDLKLESDTRKEEAEDKLAVSGKQEMESKSQLKAQFHLDQAREEIASLGKKLEALKIVENRNRLLENELEKCRKMLDESSIRQLRLEEHAALMEASAKQMRDEIVDLQREKDQLANEWKRTELLARSDTEKLKQEMETLYMIAESKDQSTRDLQALVSTLEQNFIDEKVSSFSETFELLIKNHALREAVENTEYMIIAEAQEKKSLVSALEKESIDLRSKIADAEESLFTVQNREKELESLLEHRTLEIDSLKDDLQNMQGKYKNLEKRVEEKKNLISAFEKESAGLHSKIADFEDSLLNSQSREKELEALLKDKAVEIDSLKDNLSNVQGKYMKSENEIQEKKSLVSALEKESSNMRLKVVQFEDLLTNSQNREKGLEALLVHTKLEMDSLKIDLGKVQSKYEKEIEDKKNFVSALEKESTDLRAKIEHVEESLLNSQNREKELEALLEQKMLEMSSLKVNLGKVQEDYEKEVEEKKSSVSAFEKEAADLRAKIVQVEESLLNSQNSEKELEALLEQKTLEMNSLEVDLGKLQGKYEKEVDEKKELVSALKKESVDLLAKNLQVEESLLNSQNREKEQEALLEQKTLEMNSLKVDLETVQGKYEKEVEEKKKLASALEKESADLLAKIVHIEESLLNSINREKELKALLEHKTMEMDSLKDDLGKLQDKHNKVKNELEEEKSLNSTLEKESADLCAKILHVEASLLNSQNREKELKALLEHKTMEMGSLKDDLGKLQGKHKNVKNELEEKKSLNSSLEKESADLRSQIVHIEGSLINLRNTGSKLEALLENKTLEMDNLKSDLENVQGKHKKVKKELEKNKTLVSAFEKESADLRSQLVNSQNRVKDLEGLLELTKQAHSSEMECLVACIEGVHEQVGGFSEDDAKLMGMLDKILGQCEEDGVKLTEMKDESFMNKGKVKGNLDRRVGPLRELN